MLFKSLSSPKKEWHFFVTFSYNFYISLESVKKLITSQLLRPPVPSILQILRTFNLYSGRPKMGLSVNTISKMSDKQWLRFQEGVPRPFARYVSQNGLTIGGIIRIHSKLFRYFSQFNASALLSFLKVAVQVLLPHLCNFLPSNPIL